MPFLVRMTTVSENDHQRDVKGEKKAGNYSSSIHLGEEVGNSFHYSQNLGTQNYKRKNWTTRVHISTKECHILVSC